MIIKLVLSFALLLAALIAYRSPANTRHMAIRRLTAALVFLAGVTAVIWPELVTVIARAVGVGRGADLLLYVCVVVFMLAWLSLYRRIHDLERRLIELTRQSALMFGPLEERSSDTQTTQPEAAEPAARRP